MDQMQETMNEIERLDGQAPPITKDSLLADISNLEKTIRIAQKVITASNDQPYGFTPITPEQANKSHRDIVFLKKELEVKKLAIRKIEYESFTNVV